MMANEENTTSFIGHLIELRTRLVRALSGVLLVFLALMPFASQIFDLLAQPMMHALPSGTHMIATGVITPFLVPVKVTLLFAFLLALPWVLYQVWAFVAPGLYVHEKKFIVPLVASSSVLFIFGILFCYFFVFQVVFAFINQFSPASITVAPDIASYVDFVLTLFIAFGLTFEVPILVVILVRVGIVTVTQLREGRPYVIVGAFVVAAIVTPPDITSQLLLAIPMCLLFELGLFITPWFMKSHSLKK